MNPHAHRGVVTFDRRHELPAQGRDRRFTGRALPHDPGGVADVLLQRREDQVFLAVEVVEDGHFRYIGRVGDLRDGDLVEPALGEELGGRFQQPPPGFLFLRSRRPIPSVMAALYQDKN